MLTCLSVQQLDFGWTHTAEQDSQVQKQVEQTQSECREINKLVSHTMNFASPETEIWSYCEARRITIITETI